MTNIKFCLEPANVNFKWPGCKDLRVAGSSVILFRAPSCHGYLQMNRVIQSDHL